MMKKPQLQVSDYFSLLYALTRVFARIVRFVPMPLLTTETTVCTLTWTTATGWTRGAGYPKTYKKHVVYSAARTAFGLLNVRQQQAATGTTTDGYQAFTKKHQLEPWTVELDNGAYGHFLGPKTAKTTLLYFHGGGYAIAAGPVHFEWLWGLTKLAKEQGSELRVMVLEYELAPHGVYPLQLKQAAGALKYLVDSGVQPSQIFIAGDSAGGNLTAAVLGHLSHPHPSIPPVSLSENLGGALLISPWVGFDQATPAFKKNLHLDGLSPKAIQTWSDNFLGSSPSDNYNTPRDAPADWWKDLKVADKDLAVVGGGNEILIDDIRALVEHMKVNNPNLEYLEAPGECHVALIMDRGLGTAEGTLATEDFCDKWVLARLK